VAPDEAHQTTILAVAQRHVVTLDVQLKKI
jgi:hypothetical protein